MPEISMTNRLIHSARTVAALLGGGRMPEISMTNRLIHSARTVAALLICSEAVVAAGPPHNPPGGFPSRTPAIVATAARQHVAATATRTQSRLLQQEIRQREQFLNLLVRREDNLIRVENNLIRVKTRVLQREDQVGSALNRVNSLLQRVSTGRGQLLRLSNTLRLQLGRLNSLFNRDASGLVAGLNRENLVLRRLAQVAPADPRIQRLQLLIGQQTQQVASLTRPAATPFQLGP